MNELNIKKLNSDNNNEINEEFLNENIIYSEEDIKKIKNDIEYSLMLPGIKFVNNREYDIESETDEI